MKGKYLLFLFLGLLCNNSVLAASAEPSALMQDTAITTYIYAKMAADPTLSSKTMNVSTSHGVVVLNGLVNSDQEAKALAKLAASTQGVRLVDARRIIVAPQANKLYARLPAKAEQAEPVKTIQVSTTDPILTTPRPVVPNVPAHETQIRHYKVLKYISANLNKKPKFAKKKALLSLKKAKLPVHKHLAHKKSDRIKTKKFALKRPAKKMMKTVQKIKYQPALAQNRKKEPHNVEQMTNDFLKSALMANKVIPES